MRAFSTLALAGCTWLALGSTAFADVRISIRDGHVTLAAKDATVRQILTEWARVGRTQIVNVERISGGPVTIELTNVPEQEALDMLLRAVSGYMAAPRAQMISDASQFDRIIVMPTSAAPRPAPSAAPPPAPFAQLNGIMQPPPDEEDNTRQPPPGLQLPPALAPIFQNFPQPQGGPNGNGGPRRPLGPGNVPANIQGIFGGSGGNQQQQVDPNNGLPLSAPPPTPSATPTAPFGAVSSPGMIAPGPAQPGQIVLPQGFPPQGQQPRQ
jgi:hypothetical protein